MRPYNFGAGPAALPEALLLEVQNELLDWQGQGMSVMEIGHRTAPFQTLMEQLEADFRELLAIPKTYHVLFLGGAARTQFAMIPMNFLDTEQKAGYLVTGLWSSLAFDEANKLKKAYCVASTKDKNFTCIPSQEEWQLQKNTSYLYYTPNETVNGVRFNDMPKLGIPLIADMTSCLLSEPINVQDFGLIFAGAQKNISIAGLTIVIIHEDLLKQTVTAPIATMLDYRTHVANKSLYATPPTFNCYIAQKMLAWIKMQGGVNALYQVNLKKAETMYHYIDASSFYDCPVQKNARSLMNVCFSLRRKELENKFLTGAKERGLYALQGHRTVGGLRASLYNAMPLSGVESLITFMQDFSEEHSK